ncbi:TetR/AcrR family transcriptional regulator [Corticibacter populi]|uniref:TetR/AcrR family transcriptional regulator n=1 Tax=Corticibacter populi TaxID=1550736 RepID=A0A3M6QTT8_9BURK|nr:TetR/AcrR family transcriptional regulator [Corticibacter populi]RMX06455.1 TetR/AcrR family transcriptional regulator [Corticibacter populi]RZS31990.1 TetR family transcriptional regulator [Corticibacter populi]
MTGKQTFHHGDLRAALVAEAIGILRREGVEALSLRGIARAAGVSQAAPYRHFADKAALLAEVSEQGFLLLQQRFAQCAQCVATPPARLRVLGEAYVTFALEEPALFRLMFGAGMRAPASHPAVPSGSSEPPAPAAPAAPNAAASAYAQLRDAVAMVVGGTSGPRQCEAACVAAWSLVHGLSVLLIDEAGIAPAQPRADLVRSTIDLFVRGLELSATAS